MNEFFAKVELLAGLSETEQTELRTNIGLNTIIDDLSNDTVTTKQLKVSEEVLIDTSNLKLRLGERTSNMFLKSVTADGKAMWSPLPTYDEMIGATMDAITQDLFDDLSELRNLRVEEKLQLQCNLTKPSILVNEDSNGMVSWSALKSNFDASDLLSNEVPSMLALGALYELTRSNESNLYSNLYEVATDTSLVLTLSNNLSELSNNLPEIMSNLGLDLNLTTSNVLTSNVIASNVETDSIVSKESMAVRFRTSNLFVHGDATASGGFQSQSVSTSNIAFTDTLQGKDIVASNVTALSNISASNITTEIITTNDVSLKNIHFDIAGASNNAVLTVLNSNIAFTRLNSDYLASSEDSVPSSKALNDALQFMDTRVRTITNDPTFSETYIQINCNLDEIKYYTVENMLKLHSNLRIAKLAREPTWENIENIPSDLANLSDFYLTKDLSNIDLGDINVLKLRESLALEEMAYQTKEDVDIRGGFIKASKVEAQNFVMTASENNVEDDRINYGDETYLYMRHAGYEGLNVPGTGKWGNLPIKQHYTDIGKNSIPSCDALSNLYAFIVNNNRVLEGAGEDDQPVVQSGFLNNAYSNETSTSNAASAKAVSDLYDFMRNNAGGDNGFLNPNYKNQSSHTNAASTKALSDLHSFMRSSAGGDSGFLSPEYKGQSSDTNAATTKALSAFHDFVRSSDGGDDGFLNENFKGQTSHSNAASTKALSDLYDFMRNISGGDNGFLNSNYKHQSSDSNAASTKALSDLHSFMRSSAGGDSGFLSPEYKGQSSDTNAATTKALSAFHDFVRSSDGGDDGFLNENFKGQTSHSNAASTKALTDLHDYLRSSEEGGFLRSSFSNQTSHSNAATAKSVTDLFNYIIDGFLVKDFTQGNEETAATSGAVFNLFQFMKSSDYISDRLDDDGDAKIASAKTLSNLYFQTLASEDFFKVHNPYIFEDYLKQSMSDKSSTQPFSSTATSNVIHDMITERRKIYDALNGDGVLNDQINDDDFGKIATARSVYNLSNNTRIEMDKLNDSIYENLRNTQTNLSIFERIGLTDSQTNPLEIVRTNNCNIDLGLKYNPKYFTLTGTGHFTLDDSAISNIAASAIKIRSSSDDGGFSNLIEVDPVGEGEYEIKFKGTSLLDEISGDVAKSVADAILNYGAGDYTFSCNLWVKQDLYVHSNIHASNVYFSNLDVKSNLVASNVELSNSLLVHGDANFESDVTILSNLTVSGDAMIQGYQRIASMLSVHEQVQLDDDIRVFADAYVGGALSVCDVSVKKALFSESLETSSNAVIHGDVTVENVTTTSNLASKHLETVDAEVKSNLTLTSEYHDVKIYATNSDGSVGNNNFYLEANNVDKIVYSNVRDISFGEEQSKLHVPGELSVNRTSVLDLNVTGQAIFDQVISGTANNTKHVLTDKPVESSVTDQRFFPAAIDRTDSNEPFKELHPFSNMYFDQNLNVNVDTGLSVKNTITSGALSVGEVRANQIHGDTLKVGASSNDPVYIDGAGLIDAREISAGRLIIEESDQFSGVGQAGELKYTGGKFYGHDGTKFTSISSATVNDEETGMFVTEGQHDIDFRCVSDGTPFDLRIRSNVVSIPNTLSVKDAYVYDNTVVKSLILRDNMRQKKYPLIHMTQNELSGYVASGSSVLSAQNDFYKCFDGKDVTYDDLDDGTGHYSAWISDLTYDSATGLPLADSAPTFPGTDKKGEFCMLKLPSSVLLKQFHIFTRGSATYENAAPPKDIRVYATNDGTNWEELGSHEDLIFTGREGLRLEVVQLPDTAVEGEYKRFDQFAIQVESITVQGNKPAYCAIGRLDFCTQDESATYTDLDDRLEGVPGQLVYSDGKILCHDGTSFKQITGSTANMDRTGMFLVEGESNIKFRVNSDSNATEAFDVMIEEDKTEFGSNVVIQNELSVGGTTTFSGHLIPSESNAFDIGSVDNAVRDLFVSDNSLWVGDRTKISFTNGKLKFRRRKLDVVPAAILNAGLSKGHANHDVTRAAALQHAGVATIEEMKLAHWARYMRTLQPGANVGDIFRRDHDEDYEATTSSEAWYEVDDTKVYTKMAIGIQTSDPQEALHVNGKIKVEDGFSLVKQGSDTSESNPAVVIDTNFFGADTDIVDRTSSGISSFTRLFRIYGRNSEGTGRSWHWGMPDDDASKLGLAWDGGGTPDPDVGFVFTTNGDFYARQFYGSLKGHADTATTAAGLTTPVSINGVPFDGTESIEIGFSQDLGDDVYIRKGENDLFASFSWEDSTELDKRYVRNDSDTLATIEWAKSDTPNVKLQNATHSTWLYVGGYDGGTNTANIARIRSASAGELVVDSAANAKLYLNWHSEGEINLGGTTKVRGDLYADRVALNQDTNFLIEKAGGDYGTVTTQGDRGSWGGYAIQNQWVLMAHTDGNACGIYNDQDNEWGMYCDRNSHTRLHWNDSEKLRTEDWGVRVLGDIHVDGHGWFSERAHRHGSTSYDFSSKECNVQNWVRTKGDGGHYWEGSSRGNGWHIYPVNRSDMYMRTGSGNGGFRCTIGNESARGYIHWTTSNEIGFLNASRHWSLRMDNSKNCTVYGNLNVSNTVNCNGFYCNTYTGYFYNGLRISGTETTTDYRDSGRQEYGEHGIRNDPYRQSFGLSVSNSVRATRYVAHSDERIKSNVVDISDTTALDQMRQLRPKYYEYIDKVGRGPSTVIGFIAQEVKEVVPQAVCITDGEIPNIYETANVSADTLTFTNFHTSNLDGTNNMLIVYEEGTKRKELTVVEVVDEHTIRVDTEVSGENVFVYGQVVDDFHCINKDYLWTIASAALQEVDRQLQAEKEKVRLLESTLASVLERLTALEN